MRPRTSKAWNTWRRALALGWVLLVLAAYTMERLNESQVIRSLAARLFRR